MEKNLASLLLLLLLIWGHSTIAQIDTISLNTNDLVTSQLRPGLHQYLVYFEMPKQKKIMMPSLWNREIKFTEINGQPVIEIKQNWYSGDTLANRAVYSISNRKNFAPIYHYTKNAKGVEAFDFEKGKVTGSDTIPNNSKKDFEVTLATPTLNWELDLEIFSSLPIKKVGQTFVINFYHPGGRTNPAYYSYAVIGSEVIEGADAKTSDCWLLKINYTETEYATFWISKKSKEVLKMQEHFRGNYRYKVKLATSVAPARS